MNPAALLAKAIALLATLNITPAPIVIQHVQPSRVAWVINADRTTIYLNDESDAWDDKTGIYLASTLAHEEWHIEHGSDEPDAYAEQLRVIRALGKSTHHNTESTELKILDSFRTVATQQGR